jgi:pSer/pThr/pTyr-binding forkhead associated (FHA) protein
MSFVLQWVTSRGLVLSQIDTRVLRIGRGTSAELRSDNPAVALEHAAIDEDAHGYTITDKGSITGTYVNRKPVEAARLAKGDVIEVGDLRIEVQLAEAGRPLFLRVASTVRRQAGGEGLDEEADDETPVAAGGAVKAPKIDYTNAFKLKRPWLTKTSVVAIFAIIALAVVAQVTLPGRQAVFMPGGVSSAHARAKDANGDSIAKNCRACHDPWRGVSDSKCEACHTKLPHAEQQVSTPACMSCHAEHRGAVKLSMIPDTKCTSCHADLASHVKTRTVAFGDQHPDFTYPPDRDTLRFNHKLHLQPGGIFNAQGRREVLQCQQCHRVLDNAKPLAFAGDCQRCHKLTFDIRVPDAEVPHGGDPGLVYGFVLATYAGNRDIIGKSPDEVRRILTTQRVASPSASAVINAEQVIKTKCALCHVIERRAAQLAAIPPLLPARWLDHAQFSHLRHRNMECMACHQSARASTKTSDVLMPSKNDCVACHAASATNKTASSCILCHEYHERSRTLTAKPAPMRMDMGGGAGMLGTIILIAIAILLLVVLVPVGAALFTRLRAPKPEPGPAPRRVAPPAPPSGPTERIPALQVPPAPAPAPPPRPEPPKQSDTDETVLHRPESAPAPGGTEIVQWYGMLHCTSGPLEGQRFIIEEDGFYIGRDPQLAQVVIPDGRVSKRHVRIVPRDGKVHAIDQGSTNGTFLGSSSGERITEVQLRRGDVLVLSDNVATFVYQI